MRIEKAITITSDYHSQSIEVYIDIDADDIRAAIQETPKDGERAVLGSFSDFIRFWQAVPDEIYAGFNDKQREIISDNIEKVLQKIKGGSVV